MNDISERVPSTELGPRRTEPLYVLAAPWSGKSWMANGILRSDSLTRRYGVTVDADDILGANGFWEIPPGQRSWKQAGRLILRELTREGGAANVLGAHIEPEFLQVLVNAGITIIGWKPDMAHIPSGDKMRLVREGHPEEIDGVAAGTIRAMFREFWRAVGNSRLLRALKVHRELEAALDEFRYGSRQGNVSSGEDRRQKRKLSAFCVFLKKCTQ